MGREILRGRCRRSVEALRRVYTEWQRGNLLGGAELYAPDAVSTWQVPEGRIVSHGLEEIGRNLREFLKQWKRFRMEAKEFIELDENSASNIEYP